MPRTKFVAGNWKMYTSRAAARELAKAVAAGAPSAVRVAVCPPSVWLADVANVVIGTTVELGGQNCYHEKEGAFTGEVSPVMLKEVGCNYVILGHSERRHGLGETDAFIHKKTTAALAAGLDVILCVGETLAERDAGQLQEVVGRQVTQGLQGFDAGTVASRITIAYEPVWAIGTGRVATPEQAQEAHAFIRGTVRRMLGDDTANRLIIQYGGSVKPDNAAGLLHQPDIDGALVGGASLKADSFLGIVKAAL